MNTLHKQYARATYWKGKVFRLDGDTSSTIEEAIEGVKKEQEKFPIDFYIVELVPCVKVTKKGNVKNL